MSLVLAVDLGSTSFKAALLDRRLRIVSEGRSLLTYRYGAGGQVTLDVRSVDATMRTAIRDAVGQQGEQIRAVALTSQAQTFTLLDPAGHACCPFISWRDGRRDAVAAAARLSRKWPGFGQEAGFGQLLPALQVAQLAALRPSSSLRAVLLPSYLLWRLTGALRVDENQAAMTGLYGLERRAWLPRALRACGIHSGQLPDLLPLGEVAGATKRTARRFGLPAGIPVVLAGNDQTAGAYGAAIESKGRLLLTLGTAIAAYTCCDALPSPAAACIRGPYPGGRYYRMTADGCGGGLINWAEQLLAGCATDQAFFAEAARAPAGANGLRFAATPERGGGDWLGGDPGHKPADFARALLETLSRRAAACVDALEVVPPPVQILAGGGAGQRKLLRDLVQQDTGIRVVPTKANPLHGAARMAWQQA